MRLGPRFQPASEFEQRQNLLARKISQIDEAAHVCL
jgi:hypothetical protein